MISNYTNIIIEEDDVIFSNERIKTVLYTKIYQGAIPEPTLTLDGISQSVPYRINATLIGFQIRFLINYTGSVHWRIIKK